MASVAVLSLGVGIGSGIGIFGIFHTPNPCDGMKIKVVENLKVWQTIPHVWALIPTDILSN